MTNKEAVNWLINITKDIGKVENYDLWGYEQALTEIKEMLENVPDTNIGDTISRQAAIDAIEKFDCCGWVEESVEILEKAINQLPTAPEAEIVQCKDCKHFKRDYFSNVCGVPIITCHNICTKWNGRDGGCVTREDGYCFLGERRETNEIRNCKNRR